MPEVIRIVRCSQKHVPPSNSYLPVCVPDARASALTACISQCWYSHRLCLVCMKNKMAKLCGSILKLKLFGKPSNWCFHYLMIHLDKTPNKPSETWLRIPICSDVIFLIGEEQAPVLIWISCMNPYILPVKPSHTFVRNSIINLEKATSSPFHFF